MREKLQQWAAPAGYVALFLVTFFFFVYITFPYLVLKEALSAKLGKLTGLDIRMEELDPNLPLGFEATKLSISSSRGGPAIEVQTADVSISVLNLLIGRIGVHVDLETKNGGELSVYTRMSIWKLMDGVMLPSVFELDANKFPIGPLIGFLLSSQANSPTANPMISGLLAQISMDGDLNGMIDLDIAADNPSASNGEIDINFKNMSFKINDPSLHVAEQKFKKALLKANMTKGALKFDNNSGFESDELKLGITGDIALKPQLERSNLNLELSIKLDQGLKEQFGFLLDMAGGGGSGDVVKYQLKGVLGSPSFTSM